jgi:hypothetical protein
MKQEIEIRQKLKELDEIKKSFDKDENKSEDYLFIEGKINILNWILEN